MNIVRTWFWIICIILIGTSLMSQGDTLNINYTEDFELNGKGDSKNWSQTEWINISPRSIDENRKTQTKVIYSSTGIYFLFYCEDDQITSSLDEDFSDLWTEDVVEVFLWTDEEYPFYFEYELSPNNYELPIFVPNVKGEFFGWRPWHYEGDRKTKHATHIHEANGQVTAWTAEFFIPYALLKPMANVPPSSGTAWRANMYRLDHDGDTSAWLWQPIRKNFHDYEQYGTFVFK